MENGDLSYYQSRRHDQQHMAGMILADGRSRRARRKLDHNDRADASKPLKALLRHARWAVTGRSEQHTSF